MTFSAPERNRTIQAYPHTCPHGGDTCRFQGTRVLIGFSPPSATRQHPRLQTSSPAHAGGRTAAHADAPRRSRHSRFHPHDTFCPRHERLHIVRTKRLYPRHDTYTYKLLWRVRRRAYARQPSAPIFPFTAQNRSVHGGLSRLSTM